MEKAVNFCRTVEISKQQAQALHEETVTVNAMNKQSYNRNQRVNFVDLTTRSLTVLKMGGDVTFAKERTILLQFA